MKTLIIRSLEDSQETASMLEKKGIKTELLPIFSVKYDNSQLDEFYKLDPKTINGLIVTSLNGAGAMETAEKPFKKLQVFSVGAKTTKKLKEAGFNKIKTGAGTALELESTIQKFYQNKKDISLAYLSGEQISYHFDTLKDNKDYNFSRHIVYKTTYIEELPESIIDDLKTGEIGKVVILSKNVAEKFVELVHKAGLSETCSSIKAYTMTSAIKDILQQIPFSTIRVPKKPKLSLVVKAVAKRKSYKVKFISILILIIIIAGAGTTGYYKLLPDKTNIVSNVVNFIVPHDIFSKPITAKIRSFLPKRGDALNVANEVINSKENTAPSTDTDTNTATTNNDTSESAVATTTATDETTTATAEATTTTTTEQDNTPSTSAENSAVDSGSNKADDGNTATSTSESTDTDTEENTNSQDADDSIKLNSTADTDTADTDTTDTTTTTDKDSQETETASTDDQSTDTTSGDQDTASSLDTEVASLKDKLKAQTDIITQMKKNLADNATKAKTQRVNYAAYTLWLTVRQDILSGRNPQKNIALLRKSLQDMSDDKVINALDNLSKITAETPQLSHLGESIFDQAYNGLVDYKYNTPGMMGRIKHYIFKVVKVKHTTYTSHNIEGIINQIKTACLNNDYQNIEHLFSLLPKEIQASLHDWHIQALGAISDLQDLDFLQTTFTQKLNSNQ